MPFNIIIIILLIQSVMQPQPAYKEKIQKHVTQIRRDARHQAVQKMRNKMYYEAEPIEKVAEGFKLPLRQGGYKIVQIMHKCYHQLLHVHCKITKMIEQNGRLQQGQIHIQAHINFWAYLLQELFAEKLAIDEQMEQFFKQFIIKNPYKIISEQRHLQNKVLNVFQIAMIPEKTSVGLKKQMLKWVAGTDGLNLIHNCLFNQFLSPSQFDNVYQVLKESLKLQNTQKLKQCCQIIQYIMRVADYDDTYVVYNQQGDLMVELIVQIEKVVEDQDVSYFGDTVIYLLDGYNSMIFDYARMGVGLLATRMIISRRKENILKGLQIIKFLSEVDQSKAAAFLIEDRELNQAGLWSTILGSDLILFNDFLPIKRQGYTILANIMSQGHYQLLLAFNKKVDCLELKQLFDISAFALKNEQDSTVLRNALIMLSILIYYSYSYSDQKGQNQILEKIVSNQLEKDLARLYTYKNNEVSQCAEKIINDINCLRLEMQPQQM